MPNLSRTSFFVLIIVCCGGLVDRVLSTNPAVCQIKPTNTSSAGQSAVRLPFSRISFELVAFGFHKLLKESTQIRSYLLSPGLNCGLTVFIRTRDINVESAIRDGTNGQNIDNWKTECQFLSAAIRSAKPTVSFQKVISAVASVRGGTIPDEWFSGDAVIAKLQIPVLPRSEEFGLTCTIQSSFTYTAGIDIDFSAVMNISIHLAGCPDGKYGSLCLSDCACAEVAACDTFTGCAAPVSESTTTKRTTQEPDIISSISSAPSTAEITTGKETHAKTDGTPTTSETINTTKSTPIQPHEPSTRTQGASTATQRPSRLPIKNTGTTHQPGIIISTPSKSDASETRTTGDGTSTISETGDTTKLTPIQPGEISIATQGTRITSQKPSHVPSENTGTTHQPGILISIPSNSDASETRTTSDGTSTISETDDTTKLTPIQPGEISIATQGTRITSQKPSHVPSENTGRPTTQGPGILSSISSMAGATEITIDKVTHTTSRTPGISETSDTTKVTTLQPQEISTGTQVASIATQKPSQVSSENKDRETTPSNKSPQDSQSSACMTYGVRLWIPVILIIFYKIIRTT